MCKSHWLKFHLDSDGHCGDKGSIRDLLYCVRKVHMQVNYANSSDW